MSRLSIDPRDLAAVEARALAAFPEECCGLLLGSAEGLRPERAATRIASVEPCDNRAREPRRRFTIAPEALLAAYRRARRRGERVLGTYHSHPRGGAVPSEHDRASAWPGASYLIVGLGAEGVRDRRCWRLDEGRFVEQELVVLPLEGPLEEPAS